MSFEITHGTVVKSPLQGAAFGTLYGALHSNTFPRVEVLDSGRWIVGFRASPAKQNETLQRSMITWSDDQGQTWRDPVSPFDPPEINGRRGSFRTVAFENLGGKNLLATLLWQDITDPDLPLFNPATEGVQDMRIFTSLSTDGGEDWSAPARVIEEGYQDVPVSITGPILLLPGGTWMSQFELNKTYHDTRPWKQAAVVGHSHDRGKTWRPSVIVAHDPSLRMLYWDQRPAVLQDGSILSVFWTYDKQAGEYVNIHASRSFDAGITWTAPVDTGVPGQPAAPVDLGGGRMALVFVDRRTSPMIKLRLSTDAVATLDESNELIIHQRAIRKQSVQKQSGTSAGAWSEMEAFSIGLPDAVRLSDRSLLIVYYAGDDRDHTDIRWARVMVD